MSRNEPFLGNGYEGQLIRQLRERAGLSQIKFARLLKRSSSRVDQLEEGKGTLTLDVLKNLCKVLNLSTWMFFRAVERKNPDLPTVPNEIALVPMKIRRSSNGYNGFIGETIRCVRAAIGQDREEFSNHMHVSEAHLREIENGRRKSSLGMIQKLCRAFDVPIWFFFLLMDSIAIESLDRVKKLESVIRNAQSPEEYDFVLNAL